MDHAVVPGNVPRVLEYAPACRQLTLILLAIYAISFSVTWYRVWWDSLIGIAVCLGGYYVLRDATAELNQKRVQYFYYGTIVSMVSHIVAFSVTMYYICKIYVVNDVARFDSVHESDPGTALFVFLMLFLSIEILVTGFVIQRAFNLCAELKRNEFFAHGGASRVGARGRDARGRGAAGARGAPGGRRAPRGAVRELRSGDRDGGGRDAGAEREPGQNDARGAAAKRVHGQLARRVEARMKKREKEANRVRAVMRLQTRSAASLCHVKQESAQSIRQCMMCASGWLQAPLCCGGAGLAFRRNNMTTESAVPQHQKPRHPWNPSTRLRAAASKPLHRAPTRPRAAAASANEPTAAGPAKRGAKQSKYTSEQQQEQGAETANVETYRGDHAAQLTATGAMIERAVALAFPPHASLLDQTSFEADDDHEDARDSVESPPRGHDNKENRLQAAVDATSALRRTQAHRQEIRAHHVHDDAIDAKHRQESHKQRQAAAFEYEQRKLAVQALHTRIEREIQYLRATAEDLVKREQLLDDAFENYEHMLRLKFGVDEEPK